MDEVHAKLAEIAALVEGARAMPMSASCVVNRADLLGLLADLQSLLPDTITRAQEVLGDKRGRGRGGSPRGRADHRAGPGGAPAAARRHDRPGLRTGRGRPAARGSPPLRRGDAGRGRGLRRRQAGQLRDRARPRRCRRSSAAARSWPAATSWPVLEDPASPAFPGEAPPELTPPHVAPAPVSARLHDGLVPSPETHVPENRKQQHRLDPRNPLVLDTRELGRRPGSMRPVQLSAPRARGPRDRRPDRGARRCRARAGPPARERHGRRPGQRHRHGAVVRGVRTVPGAGERHAHRRIQELFVYPETSTTTTRRTRSRSCRVISSTSPRRCATRWCSHCRSHRCAGRTARGSAPRAESGWTTSRKTTRTTTTDARWAALAGLLEPSTNEQEN